MTLSAKSVRQDLFDPDRVCRIHLGDEKARNQKKEHYDDKSSGICSKHKSQIKTYRNKRDEIIGRIKFEQMSCALNETEQNGYGIAHGHSF